MDENAAYTVGLTDEARRNLEGIFAYVSRNLQEPGTAAALIDEPEAGILSLGNMPHRCPERRKGIYACKGYRQLLVKNYTIIYSIDELNRRVVILTIRYSRSSFCDADTTPRGQRELASRLRPPMFQRISCCTSGIILII